MVRGFFSEITGTAVFGEPDNVPREIAVDLAGPTLSIKDPLGNSRRGARLTTRLNRTDFGLAYNAVLEGGRLAIGETVEVGVDLEFIRQQEPAGQQEGGTVKK
jgi:hypothetical protein